MKHNSLTNASALMALALGIALAPWPGRAQDRLKSMPGYERFEKMNKEIPGSVKMGSLSVTWLEGGSAIEYQKDDKRFRYDIPLRQLSEVPADPPRLPREGGQRRPPFTCSR